MSGIRIRAALIALVPMIGFFFVSFANVTEHYPVAMAMQQVQDQARLVTQVSAVVHELQKERGASALHLSSGGKEFTAELDAQRRLTDQRASELRRSIAAAETVAAAVQERGTLAGLGELRRAVSSQELVVAQQDLFLERFRGHATAEQVLASQTARATDEIARQITTIQAATGETVQGIRSISQIIGEISEMVANIAEDVRQQGVATESIARHVESVSNDAQGVQQDVQDVTVSSASSFGSAIQVLWAADDLADPANRLGREMDDFLRTVRAGRG